MTARPAVDVMLIGHLAKDRIVVNGQARAATGGAVYYGGMTLLCLGLRVAIVTRLAREDFPLLTEFEAKGVQLFPVEAEGTSGIENVHPDPASDRRICHPLGFAGPFGLEDLPDIQARLYYVGTIMPGEVELPFLQAVATRGPVALDCQGMLRKQIGNELVTGSWPEKEEGLSLARFLKVDDVEAKALVGEGDPYRAVRALAEMGPEEVVLTHRHGVAVLAESRFFEAPFRPRSMAGRTGRGDSCFSAYVGKRLAGSSPEEATRFAAALTTLKLEQPGPFCGTLEDVERLLGRS